MRRSQKSKMVTWASDEYLCQVRLFLSEDSPSTVGLSIQDHLQAKSSWASHSSGIVPDENLPPGFEGTYAAHCWTNKLSQIPLAKWRCPPRFVLNASWRVVAGEESEETEIQNQREMRVLEAIYPRPSAIPPDPSMVVGAEESFDQGQHAPLIPITPIEDEDAASDAPLDSFPISIQQPSLVYGITSSQCSMTANHHPAQIVPSTEVITGVDPNVLLAAHTAVSALMANNDQGNLVDRDLVDRDLLIKILSDPKMIEQLVRNHGASTSTQSMPQTSLQNFSAANSQNMVPSTTKSMPSTSMQNRLRPITPTISLPDTAPIPISRTDPSRPEHGGPPVGPAPTGVFYPTLNRVASPLPNMRSPVTGMPPAPPLSVGPPVAKDINYYKSLIQQHGGEKQETLPQFIIGSNDNHHLVSTREPSNNPKPRDSKPKIMKPCMYFNSARGCRNGANCAYQHDTTSQKRLVSMPDSQAAKRMKMDREITGT